MRFLGLAAAAGAWELRIPDSRPKARARNLASSAGQRRQRWRASAAKLRHGRDTHPGHSTGHDGRRRPAGRCVTFSARPWTATPCRTWTPKAQILDAPTHTPGKVRRHSPAIPSGSSSAITACAMPSHVGEHAPAQPDDGIADQLAGAVVGHLATPAWPGQTWIPRAASSAGWQQQVLGSGPAAQRDHRIVLAQEQGLGAPPFEDLLAQALLERGRPVERLPPEPDPVRRDGQRSASDASRLSLLAARRRSRRRRSPR